MYLQEPVLPEDSKEWRRMVANSPPLDEFTALHVLSGWAFKYTKTMVGDPWEKRFFLFLPKFVCYFHSSDRASKMLGCHYLLGATVGHLSKDSLPAPPHHNPPVASPAPFLVINSIVPSKPDGNFKELVILLFTTAQRDQWERHVQGVSKLLLVDQMTMLQSAPVATAAGSPGVPTPVNQFGSASPGGPIRIGEPKNFKQAIHVELDPSHEFGLKGLPAHFEMMLRKSGITKEELRANPKDAVAVLTFTDKYMSRESPDGDDTLTRSFGIDDAPLVGKEKRLADILNPQNPIDVYKDFKKLDAGSQGEVFSAKRISDGMEVAVKKILIKNEKREFPALEREILTMHAATHPNILTMYSCHRTGATVWIAMELMRGGKLTDIVDIKRGDFTDSQIAYIIKNILQGLGYLHQHRQMHRDIKSDNVLMDDFGNLKLGDFGFTAGCGGEDKRKTVVGTPYWMAPEVIKGDEYNYKADIWSLGILGLELCDGEPPLMEMAPMKALYVIVTQPAPRVKSTNKHGRQCCDFIAAMLVKNPAMRPDSLTLLQHPFMGMACPDGSFLKKK